LQEAFGQPPQVVLTMPILEGLDGAQKMSKSLGNYIGINEAPDEMFGKLMSVSDTLMWRYFDLLSARSAREIAGLRQQVAEGANPRDIKFLLGVELVTRFHGAAAAARAQEQFVARFQRGALPADIETVALSAEAEAYPIANLLKDAGLVASTSEALRMIQQGAVRLDGERVEDAQRKIARGETHVVQVGKRRVARVSVN